jgi:hypothetical protein
MNIPIYEQETVIQISRDSDKMKIWTSDSTMMTRLDKLCEKSTRWTCTSEGKIDGDVVNKEYIADRALLSLIPNTRKMKPLTEEQKAQKRAVLEETRKTRI